MNTSNIIIPKNFAVDEASDFREEIILLINKGERDFTLNFSECTFIDSTGLGVLVSIYKKCEEINANLKLHSINSQVMRIFELTRLDKVFNIK
ncbi:STAS domain-containing protein [Anaeromicrobium sediminis]|uniref:Anti-sigma factor antagonist n=1 Tax=Anaeromicrobium sediminis TaxID=1478221 RepID=A0A267ML79_9FIRM|nr:STAS domain-containing protein [Anaeromicrobium sediminis]PAB59530.1 anti-anti-sigma factor [Anaeromicrobium sediminis]